MHGMLSRAPDPSRTNPNAFLRSLKPPEEFQVWQCQKELLPLHMQPNWMGTWCWVMPSDFQKHVDDPKVLPPSNYDPKCLVLNNEGSYANQRKLMFRQKEEMECLVPWLEESTYALMQGMQRWGARDGGLELAGDRLLCNKWLASL